MALKARLRYPSDLPWDMEYKLINQGGFRVFSRDKINNWVIFEKDIETVPSHNFEVLINGELPEDVQLGLRRRCNSVVSLYLEPEAHIEKIRTRLNNIAATLPKHRKKFVLLWIQNNVDAEDAFGCN